MKGINCRDERYVSWKILLSVAREGKICAIGFDTASLTGLARSYKTVDIKPGVDLKYDAIIVCNNTPGVLSLLQNLIYKLNPNGVVVDATNQGRRLLNDAGFRYVRQYAPLPARKPRLFIPLVSRKVREKGLAFHSPGSLNARLSLAAIKGLNLIGVKRHLTKHTISIYARDKSVFIKNNLFEWLSQKLGYPIHDMVIFTGSESPRRKITVLALAGRYGKDVVVKVADTELGEEAIEQESKALQAIEASDLVGWVPKLVAKGKWDSYTVQIQEAALEGIQRQIPHLTTCHLEFLSRLSRISRQNVRLRDTQVWQALRSWAHTIPLAELSRPLRNVLRTVLSGEFAETQVTCHCTHGDFAPWNIKLREGRLFVYDWEESLSDGLALTDLFHFLYRQASLIGPWPGGRRLVHDMLSHMSVLAAKSDLSDDMGRCIMRTWILREHMERPCKHIMEMAGFVASQ